MNNKSVLVFTLIIIVIGITIFGCWYFLKKNEAAPVPSGILTLEEAKSIALESPCVQNGGLTGQVDYNPHTKTWWFETDIVKEGCSPACVVSEETRTAEINWRCAGLEKNN